MRIALSVGVYTGRCPVSDGTAAVQVSVAMATRNHSSFTGKPVKGVEGEVRSTDIQSY